MKVRPSEYRGETKNTLIRITKNTLIRINVPVDDEKLDIYITNCEDDGYEIRNIEVEELKELSDVFLEMYKIFKKS